MINVLNRNDKDPVGVAGNYAKMRFWLEFPWKFTNFHISRGKAQKKLGSHARVDSSEGCKSIVFSKVLGMVFPPLAGFLPDYNFAKIR